MSCYYCTHFNNEDYEDGPAHKKNVGECMRYPKRLIVDRAHYCGEFSLSSANILRGTTIMYLEEKRMHSLVINNRKYKDEIKKLRDTNKSLRGELRELKKANEQK